jgi:phytanoyl-CoA dioxygenase PhyH
LVPSFVDEDPRVLKSRFEEFGYLYLKQAVPEGLCESLLASILHHLAGVVGPGVGVPQLHGRPFCEGDALWNEVYPEVQSEPSLHEFFHRPELRRLMELLWPGEVFVYPMKMARVSTPGRLGDETPPHQDAHSHQAPKDMAGMWVALHDVAENMGRLKILPGSHHRGVRQVFEAQGVGGVQCEILPEETTWHVSNMQRGDVIIFHSCTIHKAEPNTSPSDVRVSVDTRFCRHGTPVFSLNLYPHHSWTIDRLDWEYVYRNWPSTDLQHYWKDYPELF